MDEWVRLRKRVLRRIKPSAALTQRARAAANEVIRQSQREGVRRGLRYEPVLVGSIAKETHLRPQPDIDVFLLFPVTTSREDLERHGIAVGKTLLKKPTLRYAEHPYVHGRFGRFDFDVVPAYKIRTIRGRISAVDRSPLHAHFVRQRLKPAQRDEVRLLKQFLKGIGCYGAETATGGFSGYMAEILILKFQDFPKTLGAFAKPKPPLKLALRGAAGNLGGALVFADPVDGHRNAAAAVSPNRLDAFLRAARAFVQEPRMEFFWPRRPRPLPGAQLKGALAGREVVVLEVPTPTVRPEAVVPHLRRLADKITRRLEDEGFQVPQTAIEPLSPRKLLILIEHVPDRLSEMFVHRGPPADAPEHARRFLKKWQGHPDAVNNPHVEDARYQVTVKRRLREPIQILGADLQSLLQGLELDKARLRRVRLRRPSHCLQTPKGRLALTKFLDPRDPWTID